MAGAMQQQDGLQSLEDGLEKKKRPRRGAFVKPLLYLAMNVVSASSIVFANKAVFSHYNFNYTFALTWIHTLATLLGMRAFAAAGVFAPKALPQAKLFPLAAAFVAYIVLCNVSLKVNTVGFYQVMKIAVAPTVLLLEVLLFRRIPSPRVTASVLLVCLGIGLATVSDSQVVGNSWGILVGGAATVMTALYQIWAGTKQKELAASSNQLLHAYTPQAALMLGLLVPLFEPMGWAPRDRTADTLLGYQYSLDALLAIALSALLGLMVSLSTFLVIGATSSLTYNVVGHAKTIIILTGGCLFFGDAMPPKKLAGVAMAMAGIVWYTHLTAAKQFAGGGGGSSSSSSSTSGGGAAGSGGGGRPKSSASPAAGYDRDGSGPMLLHMTAGRSVWAGAGLAHLAGGRRTLGATSTTGSSSLGLGTGNV